MPWVAANNRHASRAQAALSVVAAEEFAPDAPASLAALIHPTSLPELGADAEGAAQSDGFVRLFARTHAQFVLKTKVSDAVPEGAIVLNEAQRLNFEVTVGPEKFPWSLYDAEDPPLASITIEVKPSARGEAPATAERKALRSEIGKALWGAAATLHERYLLELGGRPFAARVVALEAQPEEDEDAEAAAAVSEDIHRGVLTTTTRVYLQPDLSYNGAFELTGEPLERLERPQANMVDVFCADEEWFPVKKRLLQPCIALAKHVLSKSQEREKIHVDLDCCTFDKVLRYLEAEARGETFGFDLHETDQLLGAAKTLRLIGLQRLCEKAVGEYRSSIRAEIPWEEVQKRNSEGDLLLVIDGGVYDVTDWLEHHPGGNTIIPEQALNVDATVLFEVYHASRESFLFLRQLYVGRLRPEDQLQVPPPVHVRGSNEASPSFLEQLREFMGQSSRRQVNL